MRIIQINASYKPAFIYGGPTMSVSKLSEVLISKNIDLEVLTTAANGRNELNVVTDKAILVENVTVTYYKRLTKDHTHFSPALYSGLIQKIAESKKSKIKDPIIAHIHAWWNLVSVISCLLAVIKKVPVVLSPRGTLSSYSFGNKNNLIKRLIHNFISKPLLSQCHLHATSENEKKALLALVRPRSVTVIPNLVSLPNEKGQESIIKGHGAKEREDVFELLFLSRIEQKKGLELLFSALEDINLNYHLTIAGSGDVVYVNKLKKLSEDRGINTRISWIGQQDADRKFSVMADHHLFILPSYDENFANVVIESLAIGTAVLITENVGLSDYVIKNGLGWVCTFDLEDLKNSLLLASRDMKKLEKIRQHAPEKIRMDFSDDRLCERYIEMYKRILLES